MTSNNLTIKLVRHGQSQSNTKEVEATFIGDHNVALTPFGEEQAKNAGKTLVTEGFFEEPNPIIYCSPYKRTRQTCQLILSQFSRELILNKRSLKIYEDPRLREVERGYNKAENHDEIIDCMRATHGKFFYRLNQGESPADCYDRICTFLESLMRQVNRKNAEKVLIVAHGMTIRCFVMRFLHLTIEDFDAIRLPKNGEIVTIAQNLETPVFTSGDWGTTGVSLYD